VVIFFVANIPTRCDGGFVTTSQGVSSSERKAGSGAAPGFQFSADLETHPNYPKLMSYEKKRQPRNKPLFGGFKYVYSLTFNLPGMMILTDLFESETPTVVTSPCQISRLRAANQKVFAAETVAALKTRVDLEESKLGKPGIPKDGRSHGESALFFSRMRTGVVYLISAHISARWLTYN
jgi:hypothetical protein